MGVWQLSSRSVPPHPTPPQHTHPASPAMTGHTPPAHDIHHLAMALMHPSHVHNLMHS
jgi:hypothetical protein